VARKKTKAKAKTRAKAKSKGKAKPRARAKVRAKSKAQATKAKRHPTAKTPRKRVAADPKRAHSIIEILNAEYPDAHCMLNFSSPFELLIATVLAAQCTDAMVNRVTETLFRTYPTPQVFIDAPSEEIERAIYKTGFFRNKTKSIKKCCHALVEDHGGAVPATMEELLALGGVGRKTANCVLGNAFGIPGIVVDTHVRRLSNRMGLTSESDPDRIEVDLNSIVSRDEWTHFSHVMTNHGRVCCTARAPRCGDCPIEHLCPKIFD
jgi:endonuclease-3